jgi:hypothetical protein
MPCVRWRTDAKRAPRQTTSAQRPHCASDNSSEPQPGCHRKNVMKNPSFKAESALAVMCALALGVFSAAATAQVPARVGDQLVVADSSGVPRLRYETSAWGETRPTTSAANARTPTTRRTCTACRPIGTSSWQSPEAASPSKRTALRKVSASLAQAGLFFSARLCSGSHRSQEGAESQSLPERDRNASQSKANAIAGRGAHPPRA